MSASADTVIIDSGGANLASLCFALDRLNVPARVTTSPQEVLNARRVILPGVGSAADAMKRLRAAGLADVLPTLKQPVLGICLGMQLLFKHSEEGDVDCLWLSWWTQRAGVLVEHGIGEGIPGRRAEGI